MGLINKGGAWYSLDFLVDKDNKDNKDKQQKLQGTEKIRNFLLENPDAYTKLSEMVKETMGIKC